MSIYHLHMASVSRAKGASACASVSYITGEKIKDELTQTTYNYGRKERVLLKGSVMPSDAPQEWRDPATFANALNAATTKSNACIAKTIELALPCELSLDAQRKLVETFVRDNLTAHGYCAAYAIHDAGKSGKNYHAHIEVSNKPWRNGKWANVNKTTFALDKNGNKIPIIDAKTGQQKVRVRKGKGVEKCWQRINVEENLLHKKNFVRQIRKEWELACNAELDANHQIDCRSHAERGIVDEPTIHEGYGEGRAERHELNEQIRARNAQLHHIIDERKQAERDLTKLTHNGAVQANVRADQTKKREQKAQQENLLSRASAPPQKNPEQTQIKNAPTQPAPSPRVNDVKQSHITPIQKPLPHLFLVRDYNHLHSMLYKYKSKNPQLKKRLDALNLRGDKNNYSYIFDSKSHNFVATTKRSNITNAIDLNKRFAKGKPLPLIKHNAPPPRVNIGDNFLAKFSQAQSAINRANELQQKALDNAAISANIASGAAYKAMSDAENAQQEAKDFFEKLASEMRSQAADARGIAQMKMEEAQSLAAAANDVPHD